MGVTIIFSDGSKQLAHNTDDLRERWELREHIGTKEIRLESKHGYGIPYPSEQATYEELLNLAVTYKPMFVALDARLATLQPRYDYRSEIAHIAFVRTQIIAAKAQVELQINQCEKTYIIDKLKRERAKLWHYSQSLEKLVIDLGGILPPEPYDGYRPIESSIPDKVLEPQA